MNFRNPFKVRSNWPFLAADKTLDAKEKPKKQPQWKVLEDRKAREAVMDYAMDQTRTFTEIKISNILNRVQTVADSDAFQKIK